MGVGERKETHLKKRTPSKATDTVKDKPLVSLPDFLVTLQEGERIPVNSTIDLEKKPSWVNDDLIRRGQAFFGRNELGLGIVEVVGLFMVYTVTEGISPLIYTGKSITLFKGYKRYLSTGKRIMSWFVDDLWKSGTLSHRNMKMVRDMHERIRQKMRAEDPETLKKLITIEGQGVEKLRTGFHKEAVADFNQACPFARRLGSIHDDNDEKFFNQMNMALVQFGFLSLPILCPENFGIHGEKEEDFEGFIHLWHLIGYYLGIEDKYNIAKGSLEEVRQRCRDMIEYWIKPALSSADENWAHMTHLVTDSISLDRNLSYSTALLLLCDCLVIPVTNIWNSLLTKEWIHYKIVSGLFYWFFRFPPIKSLFTWWSKMNLEQIYQMKPSYLKEIEKIARKKKRNIFGPCDLNNNRDEDK